MIIALAVIRTLIGLGFIAAGIAGLIAHAAFAGAYVRWGIPVPGFSTFLLGAIETVCGGFLAVGWLVRPAALVLATIMVELAITAGRVEGGVYLLLPPLLFFALVFYAWRSGRVAVVTNHRPGTQ